MSLDMISQFDFNDIVDENTSVSQTADAYLSEDKHDGGNDEFDFEEEFGFDDEEGFEDDVEEDDNVGSSSLQEIAESFDSIDDDIEFTIHGEKVTKADIAEVVRTRADMKEAHEGLTAYVSNLSEVEMRVNTYLSASMTETETRLRQVEGMLDRPENMTPTELQRALIAKKDLMARQTQLEQNAQKIRSAEEERRQAIDLMKIRQTDATLKMSVPGYKGVQTLQEIASWAQKEGIDEAALRNGMSPALIKALMDAKSYREKVGGKKQIREAAQKRVAPRSTSSRQKSKSPTVSRGNTQKAYEKAMASGDSATAFAFLTD